MSKVITTTYSGGSRFTATDGDGNRTSIAYDSGMQLDGMHAAAARALCEKMGWKGTLVGGYLLKSGKTVGRVFVSDDSHAIRLDV
jgi:hypothetical protein